MKVTEELRNKIIRSVRAKYNEAATKQNNAVSEMRTALAKEMIDEIESLFKEHAVLEKVMENNFRNWRGYIKDNIHHYASEENLAKYKALQEQSRVINDNAENEISNLLVMVSYGKDIEDIKSAFKSYNVPF